MRGEYPDPIVLFSAKDEEASRASYGTTLIPYVSWVDILPSSRSSDFGDLLMAFDPEIP